ncbi:Ran-specific GTPase-activating protein 30 [Coemansia sp. RSA 2703]|nr:Ran-specific GTPase-activating protein 30 [Coemansia sp. RSA 2703]
MNDFFYRLVLLTVHIVGTAAFRIVNFNPVRRVIEYISSTRQVPTVAPAAATTEELAHQHMRLETTSGVLQLTARLRKDIQQFAAALPANPEQSAKPTEGMQETLARMRMLVDRIDAAVPLLNLALTTSGAHPGAALPDSVSPGRLMQASGVLARAPSPVAGEGALVGPVFTLRLFSLFAASVRAKTLSDVTWKEEYVLCHAALWKMPGDLIEYELRVVEDLDDGWYHQESEKAAPQWAFKVAAGYGTPGRTLRLPLRDMCSMHYTSVGELLNIEDSVAPVLVISLSNSSACSDEGDMVISDANKNWYAMELMSREDMHAAGGSDDEEYSEFEDKEGDNGDEDDEDEGNKIVERDVGAIDAAETVGIQAEIMGARRAVEMPGNNLSAISNTSEISMESPAKYIQCSLGLLECMVRLAYIETNEQISHLDVSEERLHMYLINALHPTFTSGSVNSASSHAQASYI